MGKGGKGKGRGWQPRQVGTFSHLKNFRKGLAHQVQRCRDEIGAATARGDNAAVQAAQHRLEWVWDKQRRLDEDGEMVTDRPSWQNGRELPYGSLQDDARRWMEPYEIKWNNELISEEAAASSSAAATASGATQAAATASTLGAAGAKAPATPLLRIPPDSPSLPPATPTSPASPSVLPLPAPMSPQPAATTRGSSMWSDETPDYEVIPSQAETAGGSAAKRSSDTPDGGMLKSKARGPDPTGPLASHGSQPWRKPATPTPPTGPPPPPRERLMSPTVPPQSRTLTKEVDDANEPERARRAHVEAQRDRATVTRGTASHRAATAKSSKEEMKTRKEAREQAATAAQSPGASTAHLTFANKGPKQIALLKGEEAAKAMATKPSRLPDLILQTPHEAVPAFHEDWTIVEGSDRDPRNWEQELKLRDSRNRMIHEYLRDGRSVFYKSSGNSMWPLVQANDGCTFHPIQAVTAMGGQHAVNKEASEIGVGDIVFCQVQRSQQYYAHIVLRVEYDYHAKEPKYWIGNIMGNYNGWCFREHIYGILVEVQVEWQKQYYVRPHPKSVYQEVKSLVEHSRWSRHAQSLCEPSWDEAATAEAP